MSSTGAFVIVGAGLAGAKAAQALRDQGFDGRLVLVGAEQHRPYERPALSKGYLASTTEREKIFVHPETWYREHEVQLLLGQPVTGLDRAAHRLQLADGTSVGYDRLLISTGASPRRPALPGTDAAGVHFLRTLEDCEAIRTVLQRSSRLAVIGAGWIGLEVTAVARQAGLEVTVVEAAELPLLRVLGPEMARMFADLHGRHGVDFRFGSGVAEILSNDGRASGIRLLDGSVVEADAVLVAVGVAPNTELAQAAGLEVDNGIVVDATLRTSDPDIFAAGDVANVAHPFYGKHIRVEHWANALNQPATAAASMLGRAEPYTNLPYFYTDQYELGMEYVGYVEPSGYDQLVLRGEVAAGEFIAFWLKDCRLLAGMNVNVWDVTDPIKTLIRSQAVVDPARLADATVPLDEVVPSQP